MRCLTSEYTDLYITETVSASNCQQLKVENIGSEDLKPFPGIADLLVGERLKR